MWSIISYISITFISEINKGLLVSFIQSSTLIRHLDGDGFFTSLKWRNLLFDKIALYDQFQK